MSELTQEQVRERALHVRSRETHVAVLIMVVTLAAAFAAFLQRQAATRAEKADRWSRIDALVSVGLQTAADDAYSEQLALGRAGGELRDRAAATGAQRGAYAQALAAAQAEAARQLAPLPESVFGYARPGGFDEQRFFAAQIEPRYIAEELSKAHARARVAWADRGGDYLTAITIFAVALFLLGLTLTVPAGTRRVFLASGCVFAAAGVALVLFAWSRGVESPRRAAITAYARSAATADTVQAVFAASDRPRFRSIVAQTTRAIALRDAYQEAYRLRGYARLALDLTAPDGPGGSRAALADYERATSLDDSDYFAWANRASAAFWLGDYPAARKANERADALEPSRPGVVLQEALYLRLAASDAEYRQYRQVVRYVFAHNPTETRHFALDQLAQTLELVRRYRPRIAGPVDSVLADALQTERELEQ